MMLGSEYCPRFIEENTEVRTAGPKVSPKSVLQGTAPGGKSGSWLTVRVALNIRGPGQMEHPPSWCSEHLKIISARTARPPCGGPASGSGAFQAQCFPG